MKNKFIATQNSQTFLQGLTELQTRGASEACLMVVDGEPGMGKTNITRWWAVQNSAVYVRAKTQWTPRWMLEEILNYMNITPAHNYVERFRQTAEALSIRNGSAQLSKSTFGVVIDEADHIVRRQDIIESLRDLSDQLEIPFILVGMGRIRTALTRFPQVASRVGKFVAFTDNSVEDTQKFARELITPKLSPDLLAFVHTASRGRVREILEALKSIETFANRNQLNEVTLQAMNGSKLMNDRSTGQTITVKG